MPQSIISLNPYALFLTAATLAILYFLPKKITNIVPSPLIALVLLSVVAYLFHLDVSYVNDIPTGLPTFVELGFELESLSFILVSALTLAVLGTIDSLLTSLVADSLTKDKHDSNRITSYNVCYTKLLRIEMLY